MPELIQLMMRGGPIMYLIVVVSLGSLTVFFWKLWETRRSVVIPDEALEGVLAGIKDSDLRRSAAAAGDQSSFGRIVQRVLADREAPEESIRREAEDLGKREFAALERYVGVPGTIATITPLLGLLGTIIGLIAMFQGVNAEALEAGAVSAGTMADGIWQALLTTAAGLTAAIPSFIGYRLLVARIDRLALELEDASGEVIRAIVRQRRS